MSTLQTRLYYSWQSYHLQYRITTPAEAKITILPSNYNDEKGSLDLYSILCLNTGCILLGLLGVYWQLFAYWISVHVWGRWARRNEKFSLAICCPLTDLLWCDWDCWYCLPVCCSWFPVVFIVIVCCCFVKNELLKKRVKILMFF